MKKQKEYDRLDKSTLAQESETVLVPSNYNSVLSQIQTDVFNVVKVGSKAFTQLPVIDQARVYMHQSTLNTA